MLIVPVIFIAENIVLTRDDGMKTVLINFTLNIVNEYVTFVFRDRDVKYIFNGDWV